MRASSQDPFSARRSSPRALIPGRVLVVGVVCAIALAAGLIGGGRQPTPARAVDQSSVPVTVTITSFTELQDPDPAIFQGNGDYYAIVKIGENDEVSNIEDAIDGPDPDDADYTITPDWTFTADVNPCENGGNFEIYVQIWDEDNLLTFPDDIMDTEPTDGPVYRITDHNVHMLTGAPIVLEGNGEPGELGPTSGGEAGRLEYNVTGGFSDTDGDGLPDIWEAEGADVDCDGAVDVDLPAMGADPDHKDLFVELDWQTANRPTREYVQRVKEAFAKAPVDAGGTPNPDGQPGINLWVDTGSLEVDAALVGDDLGGGNPIDAAINFCTLSSDNDDSGTPDFYEAKSANFDSARARIFRYAISSRHVGGCAGGWGEVGGNDVLVINSGDYWSTTFMHELGHNLRLGHGGNDGNSCKPNYVSVMSYNYSAGIRWADVGQEGGGELHLDYSPARLIDASGVERRMNPLPDLDEANLDEADVLASNPILEFRFTNANGRRVSQTLNRPADYNGNGSPFDTGVSVNIDDNGSSGPEACDNDSADSIITWHDDWLNLSMPFQGFGASANAPEHVHDHTDPTTLEIVLMELAFDTTDLAVDVSAPSTAIAGETIAYDLTVSNEGPNDADSATLTSTLPAGTAFDSGSAGCGASLGVVTCALGIIESGASASATITLTIDPTFVADAGVSPAPLAGTFTVANGVAPDIDPANNSATHDAGVTAAVDVTIAKSADAGTVAAGGVVTYTLQVANDGPSVATGVSVQDPLPDGLAYISDTGGCSDSAGTVTCDVGDMTPGSAVSIDITAGVAADLVYNAGGPVTLQNTATVSSDGAETDATDNHDSLDTEVIASADLEVLSVAAVDPPALLFLGTAGSLTVQATVTNNGPSSPIDALLDLDAAASAGAAIGPAADSLAVDALEVGEEREIERAYLVQCSTPGTKTFTIDVDLDPASEDDEDPDAGNNDGSVQVEIECVVPVRVIANPGGDPASILNLKKGSIPVAILTTAAGEFGLPVAFDAARILPASVRFGPRAGVLAAGGAAPTQGALEDVRAPARDGDLDMVLHFRAEATGLVAGDTEGCAFGAWRDGSATYWFFGCAPIRTTR